MGVYKRGRYYYLRYTDAAGKLHRESSGCEKRADALRELTRRKALALAAPVLLHSCAVDTLIDQYTEHYKHQPSFQASKASVLRHISAELGSRRIRSLSPLDVDRLIARLRPIYKPSTLKTAMQVFKHTLSFAVDRGYLDEGTRRILVRCSRVKATPGPIRYLSTEEMSALLSVCEGRLYRFVVIALDTGMRRGEILALESRHVDMEHRIIHVEHGKTGHRAVPMTDRVVRVVDGIVGRIVDYGARGLNNAFATAARRAGLHDVTPHTLRHTFCSHMVMSGANLFTIQEIVGHKDIETLRRYAHLSATHKAAAVARLYQ